MRRIAGGVLIGGLGVAAAIYFARRPAVAPGPRADDAYIDARACAGCHAQIFQSYRRTGMGRSFFRPAAGNTIEDYERRNRFEHRASARIYTMERRGGRYFQRRHQQEPGGGEVNTLEKEAHYVIGSGNHARSYLHRAPGGRLLLLPVAWYAENGGFWAMNPGYDRPDHPDFRRAITHDCMFCHNGYPAMPAAAGGEPLFPEKLAEGIDCQRCHGPGRRHVEAASARAPVERVRAAIVNPRRLSRERQLEICYQCHLETTSRRLPYSMVRYDRGPYSYRPGEPLAAFILHFDQAPGGGREEKFEIAHAAYRLRQSACFRAGSLTCTTCHNPHDIPRGEEAARHYNAVCRSCHAAALERRIAGGGHTAEPGCVACHMPRRRTDDVVHVVMTDHRIQRRKPARDLLAPRGEAHDAEATAYRGEVVPYDPADPGELYLAAAQVKEESNLAGGIPRLERAIARFRPREAGFYFDLAEAYWKSGDAGKAIPRYEEALRRDPGMTAAVRNLGFALARAGQLAAAEQVLRRAPADAAALNNLGEVLLRQGRAADAAAALRQALRLDPDLPAAHNNLGEAVAQQGDRAAALAAFREAIRRQPDFAAARNNLANALAAAGDFASAERHFQQAIAADPRYAPVRYNYGNALAARGRLREAAAQFAAAVRIDPLLAEAHNNLGNLAARENRVDEALRHWRRALEAQPRFAAAHFNIATALLGRGQVVAAREHFQAALAADPDYYEAHFNLAQLLAAEGRVAEAAGHLRRAAQAPDPRLRDAARQALAGIR